MIVATQFTGKFDETIELPDGYSVIISYSPASLWAKFRLEHNGEAVEHDSGYLIYSRSERMQIVAKWLKRRDVLPPRASSTKLGVGDSVATTENYEGIVWANHPVDGFVWLWIDGEVKPHAIHTLTLLDKYVKPTKKLLATLELF